MTQDYREIRGLNIFLKISFSIDVVLVVALAEAVVRGCLTLLGSLSKPLWQRQRERHQTKGLISRTMAVHVRYKSLYIS